jgi:DNA-binding NtrC family response regulator
MDRMETNSLVGVKTDAFWKKLDSLIDNSWGLPQPPPPKSQGGAAQAARSLENITQSLVSAYLAACMGTRSVPLKEFMDGFEKAILLASLRLTLGNQKDAAAILGIKPTAMFEKMRKYCINGRRMKLSEKLLAEPPQAQECSMP